MIKLRNKFRGKLHLSEAESKIAWGTVNTCQSSFQSKMSVPTELSCAVSGILSVVVFAAMQLMQEMLKSSEMGTIVGGIIGSVLFLLLLTFINNFEKVAFDRGFEASVFPEVATALAMTVFSCGLVHRVCATTSFIFSLIMLYYLNRISSKTYVSTSAVPQLHTGRGKKKN